MAEMVSVPEEDFGEMLVFAERYAINRQSYAPADVARYIEAAAKAGALPAHDAALIASDVREARTDFERWRQSHPDSSDDSGIRAFEAITGALDEAAGCGRQPRDAV